MQLGLTEHDWLHSNGFGQVGARVASGRLTSLRELSRRSPVPATRLSIEGQREWHADGARRAHLPSPAQAQKVSPLPGSRRIRRFGNTTTLLLPLNNPKQVPQDR